MNRQFIVTKLMGRCGNQFYQIATGLAYAKRHDLAFFATSEAQNDFGNVNYFRNFPTRDLAGNIYSERVNDKGCPYYADIPKMPNGLLIGFWQSFKYFDDYRQDVLDAFQIPYSKTDLVSIHVRRGDYLNHKDVFPTLSLEYYQTAVKYMNDKGYFNFMVFSDDIDYCKSIFTDENFDVFNKFLYSEGTTELEDLSKMSSCTHNILANSSFGFVASWLNQNPDKIVVCPKYENMFQGCNVDMIPESYIQL